jgi:hypothetical protein
VNPGAKLAAYALVLAAALGAGAALGTAVGPIDVGGGTHGGDHDGGSPTTTAAPHVDGDHGDP